MQQLDLELKILTHRNERTGTIVNPQVVNQKNRIVIEPNLILRGFNYPSHKMNVMTAVEKHFKVFVGSVRIASVPNVYAGKICAVLDRQHLFDLNFLLEDGLTTEIIIAF